MLKKFLCVALSAMLVLSLGAAAIVSVAADAENDIEGLYVMVGDKVYNPQVGDKITYMVDLKAAELFENIQAKVYYDSSKLQIVQTAEYGPETEPWQRNPWEIEGPLRCPNIPDSEGNLRIDGKVIFLGSKLSGYNFREEKNLVNLEFIVLDEGFAHIELDIEEMWIKGGSEAYFSINRDFETVTEGISIEEYLTMEECVNPPAFEPMPEMRLYFYAPDGWGDNIYAYSFREETQKEGNGAWPGSFCFEIGAGVYCAMVPIDADYVIFSSGLHSVMTSRLSVPSEEMVAVIAEGEEVNSIGYTVYNSEWTGKEILDEIIIPDVDEPVTNPTNSTLPDENPDEPQIKPTDYPWDDESSDLTQAPSVEETMAEPEEAYPATNDEFTGDFPSADSEVVKPATDATSATDKASESMAPSGIVKTGAQSCTYIVLAAVTLILLSGAVILNKKHS